MARVKQNPQENYNKPLAVHLRQLIDEKKVDGKKLTMLQLSKAVGVSRQAINSYTLGESVPDANNLAKLAQFFNVSTDYLLGLTSTRNIETQGISALDLGLSEEAIEVMRFLNSVDKQTVNVIDWVISHELENNYDGSEYGSSFFETLTHLFCISPDLHYPNLKITFDGNNATNTTFSIEDTQDSKPDIFSWNENIATLMFKILEDELRQIIKDMWEVFQQGKEYRKSRFDESFTTFESNMRAVLKDSISGGELDEFIEKVRKHEEGSVL